MAKNSSKTINWICAGIAAYFIGITIAGIIKRKKGVNGIGWAQAYASKKRILPYFDYPGLIDYVYIDLTERKGNYVDARIYFKSRMPAMFWISKEDARWLSELCDKHDVEFVAYNGNVSLPSLHKKIVMDFGTETERLPRI